MEHVRVRVRRDKENCIEKWIKERDKEVIEVD